MSSQEWCGTTFQQLNYLDGAWKYWWDSYWQGEGHGSRVLTARPVSEEQLLLALRGIEWRVGLEVSLPVIWGMHQNRARATDPVLTRFRCEGRGTSRVPAGEFVTYEVVADEPLTPRSST